MARYIIGRGVAPSEVVEASTAFSGWIQAADRQAPMSLDAQWSENPTRVADSQTVSEQVADPPTPTDTYPNDVSGLASSLMAGWGQVAGGPGAQFSHTGWGLASGGTLPGDDDPFYYTHGYGGSRGGVRAAPFVRTADLFWQDSWRPGAWPVGAIGYEVEATDLQVLYPNPTYDPALEGQPGNDEFFQLSVAWPLSEPSALDLVVSLQTETGASGGSIDGLIVIVTVSEEWGDGDVLWHSDPGGITYFDIVGTHPDRVSARAEFGLVEHPVISSGKEEFPTEYVFRIEDFSQAPAHTGLVGLSVGMSKDSLTSASASQVFVTVGEGGSVSTSEGLNYWGTYTIRPPRFRWIYGTTPIRQTFARDDHLAGGAYQTWPTPKSEQESNRTFGGYL